MKRKYWIVIFLFLFLLIGCSTNSSIPTSSKTAEYIPTRVVPTPEAGTAVVTGKVISMNNKPYGGEYVFLAQVNFNDKGEGAFFLDTIRSPAVQADENGYFQFRNVPPKKYVVIVGDPTGNSIVVTEEGSLNPTVWDVEVDKVLDVGVLKVNLGEN